MKRGWPLLWLSVGLDLFGVLAGALLAAQLRHHNPALVLQADGLAFGLGFLLLAWFLGGYSFLRWPWMPYRQLLQRWLLVVGTAVALAVLTGWLLNAALTAVWFHRSTQLIVGLVLAVWGLLVRRWLQPLARRQAALRLARSPVARHRSRSASPIVQVGGTPQRQLLAVTEEEFDAIDADGDGLVSLDELGKFLEIGTPLQRWAASLQPAKLIADALPVKNHEAPLEELSQLDEARIRVICKCLAGSLERAMKEQVALLKKSLEAQKAAAQQAASGAAAKFEVVAMSAGSTKDFYEGLEGRVGEWQQPFALGCPAPCLHSSCPAVVELVRNADRCTKYLCFML